MSKKCIVTGGTKKDVSNIATLIVNIKKMNINIDEVVVFHDGISFFDQKKINSIFPTIFYYYQFPSYIPDNFSKEINEYFSPMCLCKYECLRLLSNYSCVIWTDYDVVLNTDFSILLEENRYNGQFLPAINKTILVQFYENIVNLENNYDFNKIANCYSIFSLYNNFNYMEAYNYCIKAAKKYGKFLRFGEQGVLDLMLQEFDLKINFLPQSYSIHPNSNKASEALILHAYGQPKFWNGLYNENWQNNYNVWLNIYKGKPYNYQYPIQKIQSYIKRSIKKLKFW